jgi:hypothetical protein
MNHLLFAEKYIPLKVIGNPLIRDGDKYIEKNILLYKEVRKYLRGGRI